MYNFLHKNYYNLTSLSVLSKLFYLFNKITLVLLYYISEIKVKIAIELFRIFFFCHLLTELLFIIICIQSILLWVIFYI
jgi:hypothetical protein